MISGRCVIRVLPPWKNDWLLAVRCCPHHGAPTLGHCSVPGRPTRSRHREASYFGLKSDLDFLCFPRRTICGFLLASAIAGNTNKSLAERDKSILLMLAIRSDKEEENRCDDSLPPPCWRRASSWRLTETRESFGRGWVD